ncbi:MAG TPA: hypothetical protein VIB39_03980 [Candidatus Angelobacter sp.]
MIAPGKTLRDRKELLLAQPFWRLVSHFGMRLFSGTGDSGEGGLGLSVSAILAMLAAPGAFIAILLFDKYSSLLRWLRGNQAFDPYAASLPDQYFFLTFSMVITGIVTVLKWDSIFPDRRDYMNLAPLPIATRRIFLANITAIVLIALAFAIDVNCVSSILFPLEVTMEQPRFFFYVQFAGAHFVGVMLASLFIFLALFALIGTLMVLLPDSAFRRISIYLRIFIVMLLLGLLTSTFAVPQLLRTLGSDPHSILRWLPPVWFLGLLRSLVGKADAALAQLGRLGWQAVIGVGVLAPAAYIASYYRYFIRIPETIDTTLRNRAPRTVLPIAWMDQLVLHSPFEQATYRFTIKTLLRSERHSLLFGAFAGLGLVLAFETLASAFSAASAPGDPPNVELLSAPFVLAYFVICGLRFVFDIPAELRANWVHQAILHHEQREPAALAGKVILTFILPWVVVCLPLYVRAWGWSIGAGHVAVLTAACSLLAKLLLHRFHKIPFTCTYPTWKQSATVMILLYVLGFWGFAFLLPGLERSLIMRTPLFLWILSALLLLAGVVLRRFLAVEVVDTSLIFEEKSPSPFEILNLSGR